MTWVKANPLRDPGVFCGAVGCGLCFDWADEDSEQVTEGVKWIASQLLGIAITAVTAEMLEQVREGLLRAHGVLNNYEPITPEDYDAAQQISRIALQAQGVLRAVAADRINAKRVARRAPVTIDQMPEKDVKRLAAPKQKKNEKTFVVVDDFGPFAGNPYSNPGIMSPIEFNEFASQIAQNSEQYERLARFGQARYNLNRDCIQITDMERVMLATECQKDTISQRFVKRMGNPSAIEQMMLMDAQIEEKIRSRSGWADIDNYKNLIPAGKK